MAKSKLIKGLSTVNQNLNICFVAPEQVQECLSMGYQHLMIKIPSIHDMPNLTNQERVCFRLLLKGLTVKAIAYDVEIAESRVRALLQSLRQKFNCSSNSELLAKAYSMGINTFV